METQWELPVPSTALEKIDFEKRMGREASLRLGFEDDSGAMVTIKLVFEGVEAFKCTHFHSRSDWMRQMYGKLVDCGVSDWLKEIQSNLAFHGHEGSGVRHLGIDFDDGPAYEFLCRGFRVE